VTKIERRQELLRAARTVFAEKGYHEAKIVTRFWTVGILLAVLCLATLKLR